MMPDPAGAVPSDEELSALELELRQLPDVASLSLSTEGGQVRLELLVAGPQPGEDLRRRADELARSHLDLPVAVEIGSLVFRRTEVLTERVRLLHVSRPDPQAATEVVLFHRGAHSIGRVSELGAPAAVAATLEALRGLGARLPFRTLSAVPVPGDPGGGVVVVLGALEGGPDRLGVARGRHEEESASRATLHALNRYLTEPQAFAPRPAVLSGA
ncbi:MAG: hypothetical protein ACRDYD_10190 [Acidimicrobiales bacterium]